MQHTRPNTEMRKIKECKKEEQVRKYISLVLSVFEMITHIEGEFVCAIRRHFANDLARVIANMR